MSRKNWAKAAFEELEFPDSWRHPDAAADAKLRAATRRYGQLRAVVTRTLDSGKREVLCGAEQALALRDCEVATVGIVDLGRMADSAAAEARLACEIAHELDYAKVAVAVAQLLKNGRSAAELAAASPFTAERLEHFRTLTALDWGQFKEQTGGQAGIDWDADNAPAEDAAASDIFAVPFEEPEPPVPAPAAPAKAERPAKAPQGGGLFD